MSTGIVDAVLTLDIGSSGVRARAHDVRMVTRAESAVSLATAIDSSGRSTHDFADIREAVRRVLSDVSSVPGLRFQALSASGTASSFGWARRGPAGGRSPAGGLRDASEMLLWSDTRARRAWPAVAGAVASAFPRTLCPPDASYWPAKVGWARGSVGVGDEVVFAGAKDLVFEWFTGRFWTDPMSAASTGVFDSTAWEWDRPLLARVGATTEQVPGIHPANEAAPLLPAVAAELGLPSGLPVVTGGMDGPLSQLGAAGFAPGIASCTVGTSLAFRANSQKRLADPARRVWCYPVDREHWVVGGAGNNGGNVLTWVRDRLSPGTDTGDLVSSALDIDPDPTLRFVPYLFGERAPLWRSELRAAFVGLAAHHTLAGMARAAIEGIAGALVELAGAVQSLAGSPDEVRFTGGFIQQPRWVQLMTDALGSRSAVPVPESATATGAAILAWSHVRGVPLTAVFEPGETDSRLPDAAAHAALGRAAADIRSMREALWPVPDLRTRDPQQGEED